MIVLGKHWEKQISLSIYKDDWKLKNVFWKHWGKLNKVYFAHVIFVGKILKKIKVYIAKQEHCIKSIKNTTKKAKSINTTTVVLLITLFMHVV